MRIESRALEKEVPRQPHQPDDQTHQKLPPVRERPGKPTKNDRTRGVVGIRAKQPGKEREHRVPGLCPDPAVPRRQHSHRNHQEKQGSPSPRLGRSRDSQKERDRRHEEEARVLGGPGRAGKESGQDQPCPILRPPPTMHPIKRQRGKEHETRIDVRRC